MKKLFTYMVLLSGFAAALLSCVKQEFEQTPNGNKLEIKAELVSSSVWSTRAADNRVEYGGSAEIEGGEYIITAQKEDWNARREQATDSSSVADAPLTRGTPITSVSGIQSMRINVYNTKTSDWTTSSSCTATLKATYSGGAFTTSPAYNWITDPNNKTSLFTYSPEPSGTNGLSESSSLPHQIAYTVPTTVGNQPDFCTALPDKNVVNSNGTSHVRNITLRHRLTAVGFSMLGWNLKITGITVSGVSLSGTFDMNTSTWGSLGSTSSGSRSVGVTQTGYTHNVNDSYANITTSNGYLMMIPQTLSDAATVTITYASTGTGSTGGTITAKLKDLGVTWAAGDKITYNIRLKTAPAVTSGDLTITTYRAGYTTSSPMTMVMDNKDNLTFTWDAKWLKIHRGSPATGTQPSGALSGWTTGTGGPWPNIYFFATEDNPSTISARKALVTVSGTRSGTKSFNVWQAIKATLTLDKTAATDNPISMAGNKTYTINVTSNSQWKATATNCTVSLTTGTGNKSVTITVPANWGAQRTVSVKFEITNPGTSNNLSVTWSGTQEAASDYLKIGSLYWARGNLVANGAYDCKIGAPTDLGLHFNFGSLLGWGSGELSISVKPSGYTGSMVWRKSGMYKNGTIGTNYRLPSTDAAGTGIGDPCRYYLGGNWRTPTAAQFAELAKSGQQGSFTNLNGVRGRWLGPNPGTVTTSIFFRSSGIRQGRYGPLTSVDAFGYYWSSSVYNADNTYMMTLHTNSMEPQDTNSWDAAATVRCVSTTAP